MENILYLTHTQSNGTVSRGALETLGASVELVDRIPGSTLTVALFGNDVQSAANAMAGCGASRFLGVSGADFADSRYGSDVAAIDALARASKATVVLAPSTSRLARSVPGAAHRLEGGVDTHVSGVATEGENLQIQRWYYRQRMVATLTRSRRPWFLLLDSGVFPPWEGADGSAAIEEVAVELPENCLRTRVLGEEKASGDAQTIRPDAGLLFVAGAGWTKKQADGEIHAREAEKHILEFLERTQASLGGSKSLVDQGTEGQQVLGFMTHLNQVGQTGATPRHPKGLATCCHGEEPHVVGWRFINERRAVNTDAGCGWAQGKTDVLYVADAFEVMARINELLGDG